jgi:hypothetical protein
LNPFGTTENRQKPAKIAGFCFLGGTQGEMLVFGEASIIPTLFFTSCLQPVTTVLGSGSKPIILDI